MNAFLMLYSIAERHKIKHKDHFSQCLAKVTTKDGGVYSLFPVLCLYWIPVQVEMHMCYLLLFSFRVKNHML